LKQREVDLDDVSYHRTCQRLQLLDCKKLADIRYKIITSATPAHSCLS